MTEYLFARQTDMDAIEADFAAHLADTGDAHDASAISFAAVGTIAATDVQTAVAEVATDAATALAAIYGTANTWTALQTFSLAGNTARFVNTTDSASVQVARFEGDRATMADNDLAYLSYMLSNDAGTQTEFARFSWQASDVNAGTSEDGIAHLGVMVAGTLTNRFVFSGSALYTNANDTASLGAATLAFSDVYLASGAVIDFNNGTLSITHVAASDQLTVTGNVGVQGALQCQPVTNAFGTSSIYTAFVLGAVTGATADNGGLYAIGRRDKALEPYTGLSGWDTGVDRHIYIGGGGWGVPDATWVGIYVAPTYSETNDTGVNVIEFVSDEVGIFVHTYIEAEDVAFHAINVQDTAEAHVASFTGFRSGTAADNDLGFLGFNLKADDADFYEFARLRWVALDANVGTGLDGAIDLSVVSAGVMTNCVRLSATAFYPFTNDSHSIGIAGQGFADLHFATGATINWASGEIVLTGGGNTLTLTGGVFSVVDTAFYLQFDGTNPIVNMDSNDYWAYDRSANAFVWYIGAAEELRLTASALSPGSDGGNSLGTTALGWQNIHINTGGTFNFENGDVVVTHSSNLLSITGGGLNIAGGTLHVQENALIGYVASSLGGLFLTDSAEYGVPAIQSVSSAFAAEVFALNPAGGVVTVGSASSSAAFFTTTFTPALQVHGTTASGATAALARYVASTTGSHLVLAKSRHATINSHTVVQSGDTLGTISFQGSDGTDFELAASIYGSVGTTPGAGDMPGNLHFNTSPDGTAAVVERLRINFAGQSILNPSQTATAQNWLYIEQGATCTAATASTYAFSINQGGTTNQLFTIGNYTGVSVIQTWAGNRLDINSQGNNARFGTTTSNFEIGDGSFYLTLNTASPLIGWAANDYLIYDRAGDTLTQVIGGTTSFQVYATATARNVRMVVYDVDNAALEQVSVGVADSGGAGFKLLRIAN